MAGSLLILFFICAATAGPDVDPEIQQELDTRGSVDIIINFRDSNVQAVRSQAVAQARSLSRGDLIKSMYDALLDHARKTQAGVIESVKAKATPTMKVDSLWISNQLAIRNASTDLLEVIKALDGISEIRKQIVVKLFPDEEVSGAVVNNDSEIQWGVAHVEAPAVWKQGYRGKGVVIGHIDTGVKADHEALKDGFRSDHGWFDPYRREPKPVDYHGHGTHTIGSVLGRTNGIGVAPEATLISCAGCNLRGYCLHAQVIQCGQFMLCPTDPEGNDPRCDLAPQIVTNSFGTGEANLDDIIAAWMAAGIIGVWAAGNSGAAGCGSISKPSDSPTQIAVAAIDSNDTVVYFSSRGPTESGLIKPDISAPGVLIYSADNSASDRYVVRSGTSMACPHVAGIVALMLSYKPKLKLAKIRKFIMETAQPTVPIGQTCGGIPDSQYPNNAAGYGQINARIIFEKMKNVCTKKG